MIQHRRPIRCLEPEVLLDCLEGLGPLDETIVEHLGSCPHCQATMNYVAGQETWWNEAEEFLSRELDPVASRISSRVCALTSSHGLWNDPLGSKDSIGNEEVAQHTIEHSNRLLDHERDQLSRLLAAPSHPELLGRIGRYELEQLVGRGGMGLVFRAYDTELHRVVAIKTLAFHLIPIGAARERFVRESRACAALTHPHIVPMYDVIHDGPLPALVMQYIAGPTLQQFLHDHGPIAWQQMLQIGGQLADALAAAHEHGLVHRDIKPGNVLLEADGSRALLTDFGLARVLDAATLTHSGILAGTPEYMSPEQARGEVIDERSDLFSLGSLLYTMLVGHSPFRASEPMAVLHRVCNAPHLSVHRIHSEIPLEVSRLIDRLLAKNPRHRVNSANELRVEMNRLARSQRRLSRNSKSLRLAWIAAASIGIGVAAGMFSMEPIERMARSWNGASSSATSSSNNGLSSLTETLPLESSSTSSSASANSTVEIFDDLRGVDRELLQLNNDSRTLLERIAPSVVLPKETVDRFDSMDLEFHQLRQTMERIERELLERQVK